jgi:hypothetical protein
MNTKCSEYIHTSIGQVIETGPVPISSRRLKSNQIHRIFSVKAGMRIVTVESPLEADFIYWAESMPEILHLCEQPLRVHIPLGNRPFYTFDLCLRESSGIEKYYEIKPEKSLKLSEDGRLLPTNWEVIEAWAQEAGYLIGVLTDKNLEGQQQKVSNWRRLLPYVRAAYLNSDRIYESQLLEFFQSQGKVKLLTVFKYFQNNDQPTTLGCVAKLLHQGKLAADIAEKRLSPHTIIYVSAMEE